MKVTATLKNLRTSPRKVRLVANFIKDMDANAALVQLTHTVKKTSPEIKKLLASAIANAENNFGLDRNNLFVSEIQVGEGTKMKRWLPRAHGRATLLLKRSSRVYITLDERVEGKNRKTKEELEKIKKQREEEREKMIKEFEKQQEKEAKEAKEGGEQAEGEKKTAKPAAVRGKKGEAKKAPESGFLKKVFNRKAV